MTKIEEIYDFMLDSMKTLSIEDTPEHRLAFLQGLYEAWDEDPEINLEKTFYKLALHNEIMSLKMKLQFPKIYGNQVKEQ